MPFKIIVLPLFINNFEYYLKTFCKIIHKDNICTSQNTVYN